MAIDRRRVTLDVFSDVACPWCFVGLRMLQRAREGWDGPEIDVRWRGFQLEPEHPPRGRPFREVIDHKLGGSRGYAQMTARLEAIGAEVGIPFALDRIVVSPNTRLAHAVIAQSRLTGDPEAVVEALFPAISVRVSTSPIPMRSSRCSATMMRTVVRSSSSQGPARP